MLDLIGVPAGAEVMPLTEPAVAWATGLVVAGRAPRPPMIDALLAEARGLNALFAPDE